MAIEKASQAVVDEPLQSVPDHLRGSHYKGAEKLGRGIGYKYPHNYNGHYIQQEYLEHEQTFYEPSDEGFEQNIKTTMKKRRSNQK
ncbi:hypothetical protein BMS3Bbin07_01396 [bacterium BMS3Bbin07]|nr:hypothetical protein BMS3Bbin07_01396 [bacterium BMS3Bbin07]